MVAWKWVFTAFGIASVIQGGSFGASMEEVVPLTVDSFDETTEDPVDEPGNTAEQWYWQVRWYPKGKLEIKDFGRYRSSAEAREAGKKFVKDRAKWNPVLIGVYRR
jgi:hypothetical protein